MIKEKNFDNGGINMDSYNRNYIKEEAKKMLEGNWGKAIAVTIIIWILTDAFTQQNASESVRTFYRRIS